MTTSNFRVTVSGFRVTVPGTMANLGPGFDSFGLAVSLYNHFDVCLAEADCLAVSPDSSVDLSGLDLTPAHSLVFQALDKAIENKVLSNNSPAERPKLAITIEAHIPLGRGLGSSSTAVVAGLLIANWLMTQQSLGQPLPMQALLNLASQMEGHPDNVAPALLGGVVLADDTDPENVNTLALPWPDDWALSVLIPDDAVLTEDARRVLPSQVSRGDAIFNLRKASWLTAALFSANPAAFTNALHDRLHQPYRAQLIPEFEPLRQAMQHAGALGTIISGSGSTLGVFYIKAQQEAVQAALQAFKQTHAPTARCLPLTVEPQGAFVVSSS